MLATEIKKIGAHYTPDSLSIFIADKLKHYYLLENKNQTDKKITILDPSCGEGNLLLAFQKASKDFNYTGLGIDINAEAIETAKEKLQSDSFEFYTDDFLSIFKEPDLFNTNTLIEKVKNIDLIIANPPYIRTSVLGANYAQQLSSAFNLSGKLDMYQVFLKAMTMTLKDNGIICVITPNKYLTNKSGKDIRKYLNTHYKILNIIDLGDTKPFSAAVLPAIFIGKKQENADNKHVPFTKVYESADQISSLNVIPNISELINQADGIYSFKGNNFKVTHGVLDASSDPTTPWNMATIKEKRWADTLLENSAYKFGDVFKVHVGIKTTADNVFIRKSWNNLDQSIRPEQAVLHDLVSSKGITKWFPKLQNLNQILYTHTVKDGKRVPIDFSKYPHAYSYLKENEKQLASRKYVINAHRNWFEIWVPQQPSELDSNKVIFPDISDRAKFTYDDHGRYVDGNCYWLTAKKGIPNDYLLLATGVANSETMERYYNIKFQNVLYNGRKRYLTQYVKDYLLPPIDNKHSQKIIELVKKIIKCQQYDENIERSINQEVKYAFGLIN
ncbi:N-6 DNA methylase (plasmid) [Limosilactobacillus reuteri]|uniref:site-specific DNA-methyltransferase (adenine-specific) n=1 Tax=Limosilactobacillus reuteri TaxID=1598 RepID=A0A517D8A9_LIMRT|nr:N-6 DNA methylase [Limosilactobacillus reuteri]QDR73590.1 N-6 DNA methylase [Limosilactobacillus reuteri]